MPYATAIVFGLHAIVPGLSVYEMTNGRYKTRRKASKTTKGSSIEQCERSQYFGNPTFVDEDVQDTNMAIQN